MAQDFKKNEEIKSKNYKYCTITNSYGDTYLAKVAYSETAKMLDLTHVMLDGAWVSIGFFDNTEEGESYSCDDYRTEL